MTAFRVGVRVELISCLNFPGKVTGFGHGKVQVQFDDFSDEAPKSFKQESLQGGLSSVPKTVAFGTEKDGRRGTGNQSLADQPVNSFLEQGQSY